MNWTRRLLLNIGRDAAAAVRSLRATPGFTVVAVLVLTLGTGASTAIFSVVDAVILRGLPFDEADRLVSVREVARRGGLNLAGPQNYIDWKAAGDVVSSLAAIRSGSLDLKRDGALPPEMLRGKRVTAEFFAALRVTPLKGRPFLSDDEVDGHDAVAIISYGLWQRRFGAAADIVGRRLPTTERSVEIVGVMPRGFDYPPGAIEPTDVWTPYVIPADQRVRPGNGRYWNLQLVGRLRDGVRLQDAQRRLDQITAGIIAAYPDWSSGMTGVRVEPLRDALVGETRSWMFLLLGVVSFVLLLACVNVANLLLVRGATRSRELAVRAALGATRWDLARGLLVESTMLSCIGVLCGSVAAWWGVGTLRDAMPLNVPRLATIAVDLRVLIVAMTAAVATGVLFGLLPAISFSRPALTSMMNDGGRSATTGAKSQWLRSLLVMTEVALAVVLLVGSGLFLTSFSRVTSIDLGMNIDHVLTVQVTPSEGPGASDRLATIFERAASIHGVEAASLASVAVPLDGSRVSYPIRVAGPRQEADSRGIDKRDVSPDYFRVLQIPLVAGRFFTADDRRGSPPVIILNERAAKRYFGDSRAAVGQAIDIADARRDVVGVVADVRQFGPEEAENAAFFMPFAQSAQTWGTLVLRTSGDSSAILPALKQAIWAEFPDAMFSNPGTLRERLDRRLAARRFNMLLLGLFGVVGLAIAALGVYGVMAYVVTQRTHEIGIRMALGASPSTMLRSVLQRALLVIVAATTIGLFAAFQLAGLAGAFLFHVEPHELAIYAAAATTLMVAGLVAAFVPARRAAHVDPLIALKY